MPHTRELPVRIVNITANKQRVFAILNEVMKTHGLSGEAAIADLVASPEQNCNELVAFIKNMGGFVSIVASNLTFKSGQMLPLANAEIDETACTHFDNYQLDWVDALKTVAAKEAKEIDGMIIISHRVLIAEIYNRLFMQALRFDSKLPSNKERSIWVDVIKKFTILLLNSNHINKITICDSFRAAIVGMHQKWTPILIGVIARLEDLQIAKKVIKQNFEHLEKLEMHIIRNIIVELTGTSETNNSWKRKLTSKPLLQSTFKESELAWIQRRQKKVNELVLSENGFTISAIKKTSHQPDNNQLIIDYHDVNLVSLGKQTEEESIRQRIITLLAKNERITQLYGLLGWTKLLLAMVGKIDSINQLGAWIPFLLEKFKFDKFDETIETHKTAFDILTHSDYLNRIAGTKLHAEMMEPVAEMVGCDISKMQKFRALQSKDLLDRIKEEFNSQLQGLFNLGSILSCQVLSYSENDKVTSFIGKPPMLSLPSSSQATQRTNEDNTTKDSDDPHGQLPENPGDSDKEVDPDYSIHSKLIMRFNIMLTKYINVFLKQRGILQNIDDFFKNMPSFKTFADIFDVDSNFENESPFLKNVRLDVKNFEMQLRLNQEIRPESNADLWDLRREEVFCLKYLCVEAKLTGDDCHLADFINRMYRATTYAFFLNIPALKYNALPNEIYAHVRKARLEENYSKKTDSKLPKFLEEARNGFRDELERKTSQVVELVNLSNEKDEEIKKLKEENLGWETKSTQMMNDFALKLTKQQEEYDRKLKNQAAEVTKRVIDQLKNEKIIEEKKDIPEVRSKVSTSGLFKPKESQSIQNPKNVMELAQ